jgi:2,3-dihydroxybenzoate-AMP ligase/mycobactin salicyl-AMP ligase
MVKRSNGGMNRTAFPRHGELESERYSKYRWWLGMTLSDLLNKAADLYPRKEALIDDRTRLTYAGLRDRVDRLAVGLIRLGLEKGDTVLLQLPNWAEFVISYFALQRIGCIPVLLISGYRQLEVSHLGRLTEAKAWIVPDIYRKMDYLSFMGEVKKENPQLQYMISARAQSQAGHFTTSLERLMERELTGDDRKQLIARRPDPTDVAHILPSGGTTGLPKGIPRTHNDYICNAEYVARIGEMSSQDVWLVVVPVGHNLALLVGITGCIFMAGKLVLLDSTRPEDICHTIQEEKVTFMPVVPSLLKRILDLEHLGDYRLDSLRRISAGGEASSPELVRKANEKMGCTYINEFGMSEGLLCRTRLDDDIETICFTVGKPCCPYDQVKILREKGKELSVNQDGELTAKGPGIFAGYLKNPEENRKSFTEDGFFRTGDLARVDESGNIRITGRIKDIIIRGGENISPAQVEDLLLSFPGIADAAVIGIPDKELGEKVCAYIRPTTGVRLDPKEIKAFMLEKGASKLLLPERFEFVDALPMTQAAKHDKKALREDMKRKMGPTG